MYFFLFLYFCAIGAHKLGAGFDGIFLRGTFVLYVGFWVMDLISKKKRLKMNNYILWLFLFYGYALLSMWWAKDVDRSQNYVNRIIQIFVIGLTLAQILIDNKTIEKVLKILLASQVYSVILLLIKVPSEVWGEERITNFTGLHANTIGGRLAISILICAYFVTKKNSFKPIYISMIVGFSSIILYTGSRTSLIYTVIFVSAYILFFDSDREKDKFFILRKGAYIIITIIGIVAIISIMMRNATFYELIGKRFEGMFDSLRGIGSDGSINERGLFRNFAIQLFLAHPIFGYGLNNFSYYMVEINYAHRAYSHNNFWELMSTLGIVGTALFYIPLIAICYYIYKTIRLCKEKNLGLVLLFVIAIHIINSRYSMFYQDEFYFVFVAFGYMYYYINLKNAKSLQMEKQ